MNIGVRKISVPNQSYKKDHLSGNQQSCDPSFNDNLKSHNSSHHNKIVVHKKHIGN